MDMTIYDFRLLAPEKQALWLAKMKKTDWDAGKYLCWMLEENMLEERCGRSTAFILTEGDELASFCTLADFDEIDEPGMKPWIGFVYTFEKLRGRRCAGKLIEHAVSRAREAGCTKIYVSSEEKGLYEKYCFTFVKNARSVHGYDTGIFVREIAK